MFLAGDFLPFVSLNVSCYSLLVCRVSAEESPDDFMGIPLYVICCFSLAVFNIFSLNSVFLSVIIMSQCVSPWVCPVWDCL